MTKPEDGLPPFVNSWRQLYALIVAVLIILIALFYWFTVTFE